MTPPDPPHHVYVTGAGFTHAFVQAAPLLVDNFDNDNLVDAVRGLPLASRFVLPLPALAEQSEIVRILDARLEAAKALDKEVDASFARADALRQSILKQAFSGKLVPQDADDEPATILLQRIAAQNASQKPIRTTRKRKAPIA